MRWKNKGPLFALFWGGWSLYFSVIWWRAFRFDEAGNVIAGYANIWGDWAAHFTMGSAMAYRSFFLTESPFLLGAPFRYPFAANMLSAALIRLGVPFLSAFTVPSYLCSLLLIVALFFFYRKFLRSENAAMVGVCLFLFNGGMGFLHALKNFPAVRATNVKEWEVIFSSVISSMVIPQRAFQIGFPVALLCLLLAYRIVETKNPVYSSSRWLVVVGLLWGILPILHTHSFLMISLILAFWCWADIAFSQAGVRWRRALNWIAIGMIAVGVATPLLAVMGLFSNDGPAMVRWCPGWYADGVLDWTKFWVLNWGITPFVAAAGAFLWVRELSTRYERKRRLLILAPFLLLFVLLNLVLLQPWIWDNTKVLVWVSVAVSGMAGFFVVRQKPAIAIALFLLMSASGILDATRLLLPSYNRRLMYTSEQWELADWVRSNTPADSLWLTSTRPNHWLYNLTGRRVFMAYEGWLWTHGYRYNGVKKKIKDLYAHPEDRSLYAEAGVDYVLMGPSEKRGHEPVVVNFEKAFAPVKKTDSTIIFATSVRHEGPPAK